MCYDHYAPVWEFETRNFAVVFDVTDEPDVDLSWDTDGSVRKDIESGQYVNFIARIRVLFNGRTISSDYLAGCIYESAKQFRKERGYFGDMVRKAIADARKALKQERDLYLRY